MTKASWAIVVKITYAIEGNALYFFGATVLSCQKKREMRKFRAYKAPIKRTYVVPSSITNKC